MSEPESLTNVRIIPVMRQNFKTGTTGGSPGDQEREGIRLGFALGSTLQMVDSTGRLVRAGGSARSPGAPTAPAAGRIRAGCELLGILVSRIGTVTVEDRE